MIYPMRLQVFHSFAPSDLTELMREVWDLFQGHASTTEGSKSHYRCKCSWEQGCLPLGHSELEDFAAHLLFAAYPCSERETQREDWSVANYSLKITFKFVTLSTESSRKPYRYTSLSFSLFLERKCPRVCLFFAHFQIPLTHSLVAAEGWSGLGLSPFFLLLRFTESWILVSEILQGLSR